MSIGLNLSLAPLGALKNNLGKIVDQVNPFDGGKTYQNPTGAKPSSTPYTPPPSYNPGTPTTTSAPDLSAIYNEAYNAALKASQTPAPRLITFDSNGAWSKAQEMATAAVSPIYQQKMTDFLASQATALQRQQEDTTTGEAAADTTLQQQLADSATSRSRTAEDTTTANADTQAAQDYADRTEGLTYDAASRSLNSGLGASGTATSGIGQGQVTEANAARLAGSNEEVRQSDNKIAAQNTLMNRTFEDLTTSDTRNTEGNANTKSALDLNLTRFIQDQSTALQGEQEQEELDKQSDIASQSVTDEGNLVNQWINSLAGQGYSAQEIANAAAIYK